MIGQNDKVKAMSLRCDVADFVRQHPDDFLTHANVTTRELLDKFGWSVDDYPAFVVKEGHWGGEL